MQDSPILYITALVAIAQAHDYQLVFDNNTEENMVIYNLIKEEDTEKNPVQALYFEDDNSVMFFDNQYNSLSWQEAINIVRGLGNPYTSLEGSNE